jgi:PKD repeat protein
MRNHPAGKSIHHWQAVSLACLLALLSACSGGSPAGDPLAGTSRPSENSITQELELRLLQELQALGKDPQRAVAAAPQGGSNAVFNLQATVQDPDGAGGNPPSGIELSWTARVIGDYNQNGEVGISDITPLGQFFKQNVAYDAPELHEGQSFWPVGDPFTDGSAMWRAAAVDGDGNGEINAADITPIAVHFGERIDGFNVHIKQLGDSDFSILPNLLNPFLATSVSLLPAGNGPANYTALIPWPASGEAQIAVTGYDAQSSSSAPLSNIVTVSDAAGSPPLACVADLSADVLSGEAPLTVQFGLGTSSTGAAGTYRYVLATGEAGVFVSHDDSGSFPLDYTYISAGEYSARLAVVCLQDGTVEFSAPLAITVSEPAAPGLTVSGNTYQYTENPVVGDDEPPKNPLPDIEVEIYILGEASPLATTVTNGSGEYVFANLQLDPSVQVLNVKVTQAQKEALLPLTWLPDQQILILQSGELNVEAPDMNLLASTF